MYIFLTEELENYTARKSNAETLLFFCSAQDEKRNTGVAILRGIMYQIIAKRPQLITHVLPYFETPERTQQTLLSLETLWIIFTKLVADTALGIMFCVLDGLDECDESTTRVLLPRIVGLLTNKTSSTMGVFKVVVVSREIHALRGCSCSRIRLDPDNDEKVDSDIELFVSTRVQELSEIEGFNDDFRSYVQAALLHRSEGTFLWVGFAMYELSQKQTCSEILEVLKDLPTGLPAIYNRMLLQIPARHREVSQAILRWVTMAVRPLRLEELATAADVRSYSSQITVEQTARDAVTLCGPLLKLQEQEVSLVHQSAREYLLRKEPDNDAVLEAFRLSTEPSHFQVVQKCLSCIVQSSLQYKTTDLDAEIDPRESPLLRYAILHWHEHARSCSSLAAELIVPYELFFQENSPLRNNWWDTCRKAGQLTQHESLPPLHMACFLEIMPWIEAILPGKSYTLIYDEFINMRALDGNTALHLVAWDEKETVTREGKEAVARLLLDRGADPNAKDPYGYTALHMAVVRGKAVLVQLLLERGADFDTKQHKGQTALCMAAHMGEKAVVQLLVNKGANIHVADDDGITALRSVAEWGDVNSLQLLVDRGANIETKDKLGKTALYAAAQKGLETVVQLLLDVEADFTVRENNNKKTTLHEAAQRGHRMIARLLIDRGADVDAKDKKGITALHWAADWGEIEIIQLLLNRGASIETRDKDGQTAVHWAASTFDDQEAIVQLLLEKGADVESRNKWNQTALQRAAW
jgi:ankyrin repeat protein